ncbi:MAG: peptidoglycan-binding protein LysM [Acidobacteriota bacterium]
MGLFSFVKAAGAAIGIGGHDDEEQEQKARLEAVVEKRRAKGIERMVEEMDLPVQGFSARVDDDRVTIHGRAGSGEVHEKVVLMVGNTEGIAFVDDRMSVDEAAAAAEAAAEEAADAEATVEGPAASSFYTVKSGDNLSKIAKAHYGESSKYMLIFEANKPMLSDPDKIYPGQTLRIPPES